MGALMDALLIIMDIARKGVLDANNLLTASIGYDDVHL